MEKSIKFIGTSKNVIRPKHGKVLVEYFAVYAIDGVSQHLRISASTYDAYDKYKWCDLMTESEKATVRWLQSCDLKCGYRQITKNITKSDGTVESRTYAAPVYALTNLDLQRVLRPVVIDVKCEMFNGMLLQIPTIRYE